MLQLLTPQEAAGELRVSVSTLYRLLGRGVVRGRRIGGGWRISRQDLDAVAAQGELAAVLAPNVTSFTERPPAPPVLPAAEPRPPHPDPGWDVEQAR
jgi:excisionase family DNA binding protein